MKNTKMRYYFANWKMYQSLNSLQQFVKNFRDKNQQYYFDKNSYIGIAPSYEHLYELNRESEELPFLVGAQNCSQFLQGAYTGQVSVQSLLQNKSKFCIIGHSEVRQHLGETDLMIATKLKLLLAAGIPPVFCIGETLKQRKEGQALQVLYDQLELALEIMQRDTSDTTIFIAYEPIYAVGTGVIPEREDLYNVFEFLDQLLQSVAVAKNVRFLYGGSVTSQTVHRLQCIEKIDGFLIGKASLDFFELKNIIIADNKIVEKTQRDVAQVRK